MANYYVRLASYGPGEVVSPSLAGGGLIAVFDRGVNVLNRKTLQPVNVYPNPDGSGTPITQPLTTNSQGTLPGYVLSGVALSLQDTSTNAIVEIEPIAVADALGQRQRVFNVTDQLYGAVGDGVTDDTNAALAAQADLMAAGGGVLWFPMTPAGGIYLLNGPGGVPTVYSGVSYAIPIYSDHIRIEAAPGVTYKTTLNAATFFVAGSGKVSGMANWNANRPSMVTAYNLTGSYAVGAQSVTLANSGDASHFTVGDWIYIRTGQCTSVANNLQPDAEINQITNIVGGVLSLRWPTSKPYAQEYFSSSGLIGPTTTTSTAWPAIYGVARITPGLISNVTFRGGKFLHTGDGVTTTGGALIPVGIYGSGSVFGLNIQLEPGSVIGGDLMAFNEVRHGRYDWGEVHFSSVVPSGAWSQRHLMSSADTGCTDIQFKGTASCETGAAKLELHEGAAMTKSDILVHNPVGSSSVHSSLDIAARHYGGDHDVTVVNATSGALAPITVDSFSPSTTNPSRIKPRVMGSIPGAGISINSPGYTLVDERVPDGVPVYLGLSSFLEAPSVSYNVRVLPAAVKFSDNGNPVVIGTIPAYADLIGCRVQVTTAFNDATTNTIDIGTSGSPTSLVSGLNVAEAGELAVPLLQSGWSATALGPLQVRYNGTAATAGFAVISLMWARGMKP